MSDDVDQRSQLERMLARLATQKACLEFAHREIDNRPGAIFELGLGKGRTYDHLRKLFPAHDIHAFDRVLHAPRSCTPDAEHLWLGDFRYSLRSPRLAERHVLLVHADVGSDDQRQDVQLVQAIAPMLDNLLSSGALILTDRQMQIPRWQRLPLPPAAITAGWEYFAYRVVSATI